MKRTAFSPHEGVYIQYLRTKKKNNMPVQHYHDAYELYLLLDGKRYSFFDNTCYTLERGDLMIFQPFDIHYAESREVDFYERYVLNFQRSVLQSVLSPEEEHVLLEKLRSCVIHLSEEDMVELLQYFKRVDEYSGHSGFLADKVLAAEVFQLLIRILQHVDKSNIVKGEKVDAQIVAALQYIGGHYQENLSLEQIAEAVHISKYHFSRKFHEVTGATVLEYLNNVRLTKAHNLLLHTDMSVEEIAWEMGFQTAGNFTRVFKRIYGMPPREFRSKARDGARSMRV